MYFDKKKKIVNSSKKSREKISLLNYVQQIYTPTVFSSLNHILRYLYNFYVGGIKYGCKASTIGDSTSWQLSVSILDCYDAISPCPLSSLALKKFRIL